MLHNEMNPCGFSKEHLLLKVHGGPKHHLEIKFDSVNYKVKIIFFGLDEDCEPEELEIAFELNFSPKCGRRLKTGGTLSGSTTCNNGRP